MDQDVPDDQPRKLYFHGSPQGIECAVNLVNKLLLAAPNLAGKHGAIKKLYSNIVDCPADLVGLLIGKKGWTIKKIQLESGAQISINQSVREGQPRKIIVSGMQSSVEMATRLIEEVLRNRPSAEDHEMMMLGSMGLNGRMMGSDTVLSLPQLPASSGGMYTANGTLAPEYASHSSSPNFSWEDELARQATLVRGNEALFLQSHPSIAHTPARFPSSSPRGRSSSSAFVGVGADPYRKESLSLPSEEAFPGSEELIFDTRRRSGSEPSEKPENIVSLDTSFIDTRPTYKEEEDVIPPARRGSTGSINPIYLRDGLGMGFGAPAEPPGMSMYSRPDYQPSAADPPEDTIARQLQLKALQKQRILQLQQEQKERQLASLKMQQQLQMQQHLRVQEHLRMQDLRLHEQQQQHYASFMMPPTHSDERLLQTAASSQYHPPQPLSVLGQPLGQPPPGLGHPQQQARRRNGSYSLDSTLFN